MRKWMIDVSIFFAGIGLGALVELFREEFIMLVSIVAFSISGILLISYFLLGWLEKLWPNKSTWEFTTKDIKFPQKVYGDKEHVNWTSENTQYEGMFYRLDLKKEREIKGIQFDHGDSSNVPVEWAMEFHDSNNKTVMPNNKSNIPAIRCEDSIKTKSCHIPRAIKARSIIVKIVKPRIDNNKNYPWDIIDIYLVERRLWGLWKKVV